MAETTTIDGAGRVVIPKQIREHLGLKDGTRVRIIDDGGRVILQPLQVEQMPTEKNGLLVVGGRATGPIPDHRALREERLAGSNVHARLRR